MGKRVWIKNRLMAQFSMTKCFEESVKKKLNLKVFSGNWLCCRRPLRWQINRIDKCFVEDRIWVECYFSKTNWVWIYIFGPLMSKKNTHIPIRIESNRFRLPHKEWCSLEVPIDLFLFSMCIIRHWGALIRMDEPYFLSFSEKCPLHTPPVSGPVNKNILFQKPVRNPVRCKPVFYIEKLVYNKFEAIKITTKPVLRVMMFFFNSPIIIDLNLELQSDTFANK